MEQTSAVAPEVRVQFSPEFSVTISEFTRTRRLWGVRATTLGSGNRRQKNRRPVALSETACPPSSISLPAAPCNRNRRRPRLPIHFRRGTCAGRAHPALASARNTVPSTGALPAAASDSNTLRPSAPSRPGKPAPLSYCAGIRLRPPILVQAFPARWPQAERPHVRVSRERVRDNA